MATADTMEKYAYKAPTATTTAPQVYDSFKTGENDGSPVMPMSFYRDFVAASTPEELNQYGRNRFNAASEAYRSMLSAGADQQTMFDLFSQLFNSSPSGSGSGSGRMNAKNAAQILLQLRGKDPYAGLRAALQKNAAGAQQTGASAVAALRAALEARQNPYANVQFSTPMAASNPLAEYMAQSGAGTGQIDALRNLLQSWSSDAAAADQQMADRLSTSWQNDQTSRLSDAATTEAAFKQALASNLATQQGALDSQYAQYQADLTRQLADLAMSSGLSLADLGVTL